MKIKFCVICLLCLFGAALVHADIISYQDENGQEWFVDDVSKIPAQYRGQAETVITGKPKVPKVSKRNKKGFFESLKERFNQAFKKEKKPKPKPKKVYRAKKEYQRKATAQATSNRNSAFEKKQEEIRKRLEYVPQTTGTGSKFVQKHQRTVKGSQY